LAEGARRRARELALAILFQADVASLGPGPAIERLRSTLALLAEAWGMPPAERRKLGPQIEHFAVRLVEAYFERADEIDARLEHLAQDWTLERMPATDRNVLRLAAAELLALTDTPLSVALDEAVEIARLYGTPASGKFVNGVLAALAREEGLVGATASSRQRA
jgi:N utilization substance protein B